MPPRESLPLHPPRVSASPFPSPNLAILADPDPHHRPGDLDLRIAGSGCLFQYHVCKLTDFTDKFLEASANPVAKVVLAHRIAHRTAKDPAARMQAKVRWIRELIRQGFSQDQIEKLFRTLEAMNPSVHPEVVGE